MKNTHIEKSGTGSVVQSGTGSVVQAGTGKIGRGGKLFGLKTFALASLVGLMTFVSSAGAATTLSGHGLTMSLSPEAMEVAVTWQNPETGSFLIGSSSLESTDFGTVALLSTSDFQKVAASGIGKVAAGGIGKVAAGGIGKVAASGIGKVAAGGIGKGKEEGKVNGMLEFLSSENGLVAILTISEKGLRTEFVFEQTANGAFSLIEEFEKAITAGD